MLDLKLFACGVDVYDHNAKLRFCASDAQLFADTIKERPRASVEVLLTATSEAETRVEAEEIEAVLDRIRRLDAGPGDCVIFYFAGHGIERAGKDYLLATDSDPRPGATDTRLIPTDDIVGALRASGAGSGLLVMDACRSAGSRHIVPYFGEGTRATAKQRGIVSIFGCSPGQVCFESNELEGGGHGIFTHELAALIREDGKLVPWFANRALRERVDSVSRRLGFGPQTPGIEVTSVDLANVDLLTGHTVGVGKQAPRMVLLAGPPHTGKSTVGTRLAQEMGFLQVEMSTYAHDRYQAARDAGTFDGLIQEYMDEKVWNDGEYAVIAEDLLQSNNGVHELVVCGPRRLEEVKAFRDKGYDVRTVYLHSDSKTRYNRYRRATEAVGTPEYSVQREWFVRRDLTELSWGLPKIGLMSDCHIVINDDVETTVDTILGQFVPQHWRAA